MQIKRPRIPSKESAACSAFLRMMLAQGHQTSRTVRVVHLNDDDMYDVTFDHSRDRRLLWIARALASRRGGCRGSWWRPSCPARRFCRTPGRLRGSLPRRLCGEDRRVGGRRRRRLEPRLRPFQVSGGAGTRRRRFSRDQRSMARGSPCRRWAGQLVRLRRVRRCRRRPA